MKQKGFTEEQKALALRQAESGVPVAEILRKRKGRPMATRKNECWSMAGRFGA